MPAPKIPPVVVDVERLNEPFRAKAKALLASISEHRLPMMVFETLRPLERQAWLHAKGYSRAAGPNGPHPWGLAMDVILDPKSTEWKEIGDRPIGVGGGGANWDTRLQPDGGRPRPRAPRRRSRRADVRRTHQGAGS